MRIVDLRKGDEPPEPTRAALDDEVLDGARRIIEQVRADGDDALVDLTRGFDHADIEGRIEVSPDEFEAARASVPAALHEAIEHMAERLRDLHARQLPESWTAEANGVSFGEVVKPLASAGCYVPGGRAAYPSTVLMTAIPAVVAGVERVVVCTPPAEDGSLPAAVLDAAAVAGVDSVYRVGGAQAIAALAYGTRSIPAVDKIVGPGNVWVTAAKREVAGIVGIDSLAGPTELVIVADSTVDAGVLAVDLVAQAEHDPHARATLVALDDTLAAVVAERLEREASTSPRREIVESALEHAAIVLVADEDQAAEVADRLAPEHLQVMTTRPRAFLAKAHAYGAAFLGAATPVAFGDYGVGSNHVLPTMGTARFASGLRAADFVTVSSVVEAGTGAAASTGLEVETVAEAEGLPGHARTNQIRRA